MKKLTVRILSSCMVLCMFLSMLGCGGGEEKDPGNTEEPNQTEDQEGENETESVSFPLEEPVTFTFMVEGTESTSFRDDIENNGLWQDLKERTNVNIEFQFLGDTPSEQLTLLLSSGNYGDVLWGGPILSSVEASKYIASGKLVDLTGYINEEMMPNLCADIAENPAIMNMITGYDGKVYTLPKITGLEGNYLESPIWINKAWLDELGLEIPTTLDEFTNVLRAFSTRDPNGNGLPDEIPYICCTANTHMHTEALLGMWGIATKDGVNDSYVQVKDGKVIFVPVTEEYKEGIKYLQNLYTEGLMWSECFTANESTLNAKLTSETCVVGCFTAPTPAETAYQDDYVCIYPPKVEGYEPCWYYHPGVNGSKNQFFAMDKCQNLPVLMAWVDQLYDLDTALRYDNGDVGDGRMEMTEDGKYQVLELDMLTSATLNKEKPALYTLMGNSIRSITKSDYETKISLSEREKTLQNNYSIYQDIITDEIWPRPYYSAAESYNADVYFTDIDYQIRTNRSLWITGRSDIEADWDGFVEKIESLNLEEYLQILQNAYDAYLQGQ